MIVCDAARVDSSDAVVASSFSFCRCCTRYELTPFREDREPARSRAIFSVIAYRIPAVPIWNTVETEPSIPWHECPISFFVSFCSVPFCFGFSSIRLCLSSASLFRFVVVVVLLLQARPGRPAATPPGGQRHRRSGGHRVRPRTQNSSRRVPVLPVFFES